jgi:acyl carrier protein
MSSPEQVEKIVRDFVAETKPEATGFTADTSLYADGIGLDSLETAELSSRLEDELGTDPFASAERMPQTLSDILSFYESPVVAEG